MQKCGLSNEFIRSIYHQKKTFELTFRALTLRRNHETLSLMGHLILKSGLKKKGTALSGLEASFF